MRWTQQFIPTLREVPQEADIPSHQLLLRAGFIRRLGAGLYTYLPLGIRALRKVETLVREEMDRAGALEVLMPALQPREIWEASGRYEKLRDVMFNIHDRPLVLGPTHEEVVTGIVAAEISSYRQLPKNFYQIQLKFRDEIRPRFGLMRSREFLMKDAYSFDVDEAGVDASYGAMHEAYTRIFHRAGLRTTVVEADSGAMGGSSSQEFMVIADAGEDGLVECPSCGYAANLERAEMRRTRSVEHESESPALEKVPTPDARTIEEVSTFLDVPARRLIKTLIYLAEDQPIAVILPGDRDVNEISVRRAAGVADLVLAEDDVIEKVTGAPVGFAGPVGLEIPVYADSGLRGTQGAVTGANEKDAHYLHVDLGRDATVTTFVDLCVAEEGDGCPRCDGTLTAKRGVEVGHLFKLGTMYSEALDATFLDAEGQRKPAIMGSYGIGVSRTLQAIVEQRHDDNGMIWPISVAPFDVEILVLNMQHPESVTTAESLVSELESSGIAVLYDDRDERPGVKFKDADLVGVPLRVAVGERSLASGQLEVRARHESEVEKVAVHEAADHIRATIRALRRDLDCPERA